MNDRKPAAEILLLLEIIDEAYERAAWHGPNLRGSIRGVTPRQAAWRPAPARHNIWEIVVHAAYWKYVVRRRLAGDRTRSFPIIGRNWFKRPEQLSDRAWREDRALLDECHRRMREVIVGLDDRDLPGIPSGSKVPRAVLIAGIAAHDVYHAGQIQLLKRLGA